MRGTRSHEAQLARRAGAQKAARRRAETLRCPACSRKSALVRIPSVPPMAVCRWCKYEKTYDPDNPVLVGEKT